MLPRSTVSYYYFLKQGSPTPRPQTGNSPWPVMNQAAEQEVSSGRVSEASSVFTAVPHHWHYCLSSASCQHYGELYNYFIIYYNIKIVEIKCTINVTCLNYPETILPPTHSMEKLSSMKPLPGGKKVGDCCSKGNHHYQFLIFPSIFYTYTKYIHKCIYVTHTLFKEIQMSAYSNLPQLFTLYAHSK